MNFHLDFETFGTLDLTEVGAYRYASHKDTEILMAGISLEEGEVYLWVNPRHETEELQSDPRALALMHKMREPDAVVWAHNAQFEAAMSRYCLLRDAGVLPPDVHQWRCTAALCRRSGLPASLEKASEALDLQNKKDKIGKHCIATFSVPQKNGSRIAPADDPITFAVFGDYCRQDVRAEKEIHRKLKPFELTGALLEMFQMDMKLNDDGIPVNVPALRTASAIVEEAQADVSARFAVLTDGLRPTQREKVRLLVGRLGLMLPNMQADTITEALQSDPTIPAAARTVVELYAQLQFAAVAKIRSMLACVCDDGWIRGTLQFYGAGTGRWAGRLIQPQNFKKPTIKDADLAYALVCAGCTREDLDLVWGNAVDVLSSCIRNFIQWTEGDMLDADYAAIEARIVCWLADQEDVLDTFRKGGDLYRVMAGTIYNKPASDIQNPSEERELGKRTILGCGFNMGAEKFQTTCWEQYGIRVSAEMAMTAVMAYRKLCWKVARLWKLADKAARSAITHPGKTFTAGSKIKFQVCEVAGIPFLLMQIPSGRTLAYPRPAIETKWDAKRKDYKTGITFYGQLENTQWGRVSTYGGKLVENATQATAADVMGVGAVTASRTGYRLVTLIHDQCLALHHGQTVESFVSALTTMPRWADGLPIKAEGKISPYYRKS